jgi:pyruvate/2-oxoglutarate dehydrogenase complex dihydrolipoamide dehydrogenase (E3) component
VAIFDFDLGILGGGAAGLTIASGAAQFGAKVILIEKEKVLGETASIMAVSLAKLLSGPLMSTTL